MWGLLVSTILTSAADSLNPIAITQQFVLQGMVKKPKHIWFLLYQPGLQTWRADFWHISASLLLSVNFLEC